LSAIAGLSPGFTAAIFTAATLIAGRTAGAGFVSGFTATLIAVLAGDLSVVFTASFGTVPRPILATFLDEATALLGPTGLDFRVSLPLVRLKDIFPL
jgi:hypothetical protein